MGRLQPWENRWPRVAGGKSEIGCVSRWKPRSLLGNGERFRSPNAPRRRILAISSPHEMGPSMPNRNAQRRTHPEQLNEPPVAPLACPQCGSTNFVIFLTTGYGIMRRCESCSHVWPEPGEDGLARKAS